MSAQQVQFQTAIFPGRDALNIDNVTLLDNAYALSWSEAEVRTLSTNGVSAGETVVGPLYVPDLETSQCRKSTAPFVPANVTRRGDLPPSKRYRQIALAPWTTTQCIYEFLKSADENPLLRAVIFFPTDGSETIPPPANDALWDLNDGGHWKTDHNFAMYAVPSSTGRRVIDALAAYSGNSTSATHGLQLIEDIDPSDYVREIGQISTNGESQLPSLWVFLLIVLGLIVVAICASSLGVYWHQKRMRKRLRDRVIQGEVDLEALGIRRLTVPLEVLDRMPVYIYHVKEHTIHDERGAKLESSVLEAAASEQPPTFQQPTCAICLDDFIDQESSIRELPCKHIYHPDCIDGFLRDNSSLCPLCKKTVLPRGYCPAVITNAMVRRERWVRRMRQRAAARGLSEDQMRQEEERVRRGFINSLAVFVIGGRVTQQRAAISTDLEMQRARARLGPRSDDHPHDPRGDTGTVPATSPTLPPAAGTVSRREWARHRALILLGREDRPVSSAVAEDDDAPRSARWRKALGRIWPSIG